VLFSLIGWFMVFNTTFNNISDILWQSVLLVEETRVPRENHRPAASHWQTLSHNVVSSTLTWVGFELTTLMVIGTDCTGSCKSNYHTITATVAPGVYKEEVESDIKKGTFLTTENSKWMILKNQKLLLCSLNFHVLHQIILIYLWLKLLWMLFLFLIGYKICSWHKYEMLINMWILGFYILFPTLSSLSAIIKPLKFMVWLYLRRWHRMVTMATKKNSYLLISHVLKKTTLNGSQRKIAIY